MPPEAWEAIGAWFGIATIGAIVLIGMKIRLQAKLQSRKPTAEVERLTEAVDTLYDQAQALRDDVAEIQERMDFHERLLTASKSEKVDTPV